jgi:hypothetical protein
MRKPNVLKERARKMRIKVIYTGDPTETKIVDVDTGKTIENLHGVDIAIDAFNGYAAITFNDFEAELDNLEVVDDGDTQDTK